MIEVKAQDQNIFQHFDNEFHFSVSELCDGSSIVFEFVGEDTKQKWSCLHNEVSTEVDVVYSPSCFEDSVTLLSYFFPKSRSLDHQSIGLNYSTQLNTTCCVIRSQLDFKASEVLIDIG